MSNLFSQSLHLFILNTKECPEANVIRNTNAKLRSIEPKFIRINKLKGKAPTQNMEKSNIKYFVTLKRQRSPNRTRAQTILEGKPNLTECYSNGNQSKKKEKKPKSRRNLNEPNWGKINQKNVPLFQRISPGCSVRLSKMVLEQRQR